MRTKPGAPAPRDQSPVAGMIVVVGRAGLTRPGASGDGADGLTGTAAVISLTAAALGARVELVGSVGDDPEGDEVIVRLGRASVGHAAVLRDPAGRTPVDGRERDPRPRLDAEDVALGLGYLVDYHVLVLADEVSPDTRQVAIEAAAYHDAALVLLLPPGTAANEDIPGSATVLAMPEDDEPRFAELVGRYAAQLDGGTAADEAFRAAADVTGWERSSA